MKHFLTTLAFCLLPVLPALAATEQEALLEKSLQQIVQIAKTSKGSTPVQLAKKTRPVLDNLFNFESLTKRAIGGGWRQLSPAQQHRAVELFSEILIRSYAARFGWENELQVQFSAPVSLGEGRCEVPALTTYAGSKTNVLYRLESAGNKWMVYDVVIEGVSMTANYRAQFDSIRQRGPDGLMKLLEDTLNKTS